VSRDHYERNDYLLLVKKVPDSCAEKGRLFWESAPLPIEAMPTEAEAEFGKKVLDTLCKEKLEKYRSLVNKMLDAIESGNLYVATNNLN
jgi:hypothetical protein